LPCEHITIGRIEHGHYAKRLCTFLRLLPVVRRQLLESDVVYAFGFDMAFLGWLALRTMSMNSKFVMEIADIRQVLLGDGLMNYMLRLIERRLVKDLHLLVVTSKAFAVEYYGKLRGLTSLKYLVIENKVDATSMSSDRMCKGATKLKDMPLRIGYFGLLRCARSWVILKRAVMKGEGRIQLVLRGIPFGIPSMSHEAQSIPFIDYAGAYKVPDDLPEMYGNVDMVWASYPFMNTTIGNWRWARTNRFYEACYFKRPMFVQVGTEDGLAVEMLGIGCCVDLHHIEETVDRILAVDHIELGKWHERLARVPTSVYVQTNEHELLMRALELG